MGGYYAAFTTCPQSTASAPPLEWPFNSRHQSESLLATLFVEIAEKEGGGGSVRNYSYYCMRLLWKKGVERV